MKRTEAGRRGELLKIYELLNGHFGDLHWWPADTPFEVMVGAVLTQNTAWTNVEKAIAALRERGLLSPEALRQIDPETLAEIIRPSGYYQLKARRLKALITFYFVEYGAQMGAMRRERLPLLREKLLAVRGIGPETADSILLYACQKAVFVSDTYTRRILQRHRLIPPQISVDQIRKLFMTHLPHDAAFFNQYHALIVETGKTFCRRTPKCGACPLGSLLEAGTPS
jgi:endonuclease III related protein